MELPPKISANTIATGRLPAVRRICLLLLSGLLLTLTPPVVTQAQRVPATRSSQADPHAAFVTEASQRFGIPEHWIRAVRRVESAGDVRAISSAGAMGLMQLMPETWAELRARYHLGNSPYDPRDNIMAGTAYLREMHDRYGSPGFLAAYNTGPGRYEEFLAGRPSRQKPAPMSRRLHPLSVQAKSLHATPVLSLSPPIHMSGGERRCSSRARTVHPSPFPRKPKALLTTPRLQLWCAIFRGSYRNRAAYLSPDQAQEARNDGFRGVARHGVLLERMCGMAGVEADNDRQKAR